MVISSILKHLLSDDESLKRYTDGQITTVEDIKRSLFLLNRDENRRIPDHHYKLLREKEIDGFKTIEKLLQQGLYTLSANYLLLKEGKIYVKQEKQNEWQQLITFMPPLVLQSAFLVERKPLASLKTTDLITYFKENLLLNFQFTALPYPHISQLELYLKEKSGLHDLHMHLNGATETDVAWQDYLFKPDIIQHHLQKAFETNSKVKEQFEQESSLLTPTKFYSLLIVAQRIRVLLYDFVFSNNTGTYQNFNNKQSVLFDITREYNSSITGTYEHPFKSIISDRKDYENLLAVEALMYILVLEKLKSESNSIVASMFHFYLLILGLSNRLLVQQTHQNGFDQFQKHTLNGLRWFSEQEYQRRFKQLTGNQLRNLSFLEGRFAPKASKDDTVALLVSIEKGWDELRLFIQEDIEKNHKTAFPHLPELRLIAHFIKETEGKRDDFIRHKKLRKQTWEKGDNLSKLIESVPKYKTLITGVDAAANEFDASPEVFSPVFRMLRRKGIRHFTYHAGEDFFHIISGLRAVYEAITFCEFQGGDRIGHATAAGLNPQQWMNNIGGQLLIRRGEWLDNMVFVYHLIVTRKIDALKKYVPFIVNQVHDLYYEIYKEHETISVLEKAWEMRKYCPLHLLAESKEEVNIVFGYDEKEWDKLVEMRSDIKCCNTFFKYHSNKNRERYDEPIEIMTDEFAIEDLRILQLEILKYMHDKEIIIETLPTSNVRIGHHQDFSTYHLWNWIQWEDEGHSIPPIILGSDDTGIFATNIYNEYANLYCCLINRKGVTHNKAMSIIERLDRNGRIYRFE